MTKINIAELLKDCPSGMKLDCMMYDGLEFDSVDESISHRPIKCRIKHQDGGYNIHRFSRYGLYDDTPHSKCVIFPKGKTTWEGFQRPFKDGDIVAFDNPHRDNLQLFIFKNKKENSTLSSCYLMLDGDELDLEEGMYYITRLATEEEKQKLFDAIKTNGYRWDAETKKLEELIEPKFKVGDEVIIKEKNQIAIVDKISWCCDTITYWLKYDGYIEGNWRTEELEPYKKEIMEEIKIDIPKGYEFAGVDDDRQQVVFTRMIAEYPKTYEECCKVMDCAVHPYITANEPGITSYYEDDLNRKVLSLRKLLNCRDAYWKIAGEQMGLGKPWEPNWNHNTEKYVIYPFQYLYSIDKENYRNTILAFPTREMRDAFYENFKDLIEDCKNLI